MATFPVSWGLRPLCHIYYVHGLIYEKRSPGSRISLHSVCMLHSKMTVSRNRLDNLILSHIIRLTHMKRAETSKPSRMKDAKADVLRRQGALHPNPDVIQDEAFRQEEFCDPRDLVQVRYEMLRRHQVDGDSVTEVATAFGVSRQAYYVTEAAFEEQGLTGLLPRRRGPRRAHKCTEEILHFVEQQRAEGSPDQEVSEAVRKRFGISIHPRSLVRALTRRKKKQR
jgi:transposase